MNTERMFPIQSQRGAAPHPLLIPWPVAELAYSVYSGRYGRGQSLERLAERGGFGPMEMDELCPGWREMCNETTRIRTENAELRRVLEALVTERDNRCPGDTSSVSLMCVSWGGIVTMDELRKAIGK